MTEILMLILLIYPGALCEICYSRIAPERYRRRNEPEVMTLARCLVWSAVIAPISLIVLSGFWADGTTIDEITKTFQPADLGWRAVQYIVVAFVAAFLIATLRKRLETFGHKMVPAEYPGLQRLPGEDPWRQKLSEKQIDGCVCEIMKDGKRISCGLIDVVPDFIEDINAIVLTDVNFVTRIMDDPALREDYIGTMRFEYIVLDSGYTIRIHNAEALHEYMDSPDIFPTSETLEAASSALS